MDTKISQGIPEVAPDQPDVAGRLDLQIYKQMHIRDKIIERIRWMEKKVEYRNRRIKELSLQRTESLNFKLNLL